MKLTQNNSPEPLHLVFQHSRGHIFLKTFANLKILLSNLPTSFNSIKRRLQNSPLMFVVLSICNFCFPTFVRQTFLFPAAHSLPLSSNKPKKRLMFPPLNLREREMQKKLMGENVAKSLCEFEVGQIIMYTCLYSACTFLFRIYWVFLSFIHILSKAFVTFQCLSGPIRVFKIIRVTRCSRSGGSPP